MEAEPGAERRRWAAASCVLTGASRGFGRSLARLLAPRLGPGSLLLLLARSEEALAQLAAELRDSCPGLRVGCVASDLGSEEGLRRAVGAVRELLPGGPPDRLLLINNAGNRGAVGQGGGRRKLVPVGSAAPRSGARSFGKACSLALWASFHVCWLQCFFFTYYCYK